MHGHKESYFKVICTGTMRILKAYHFVILCIKSRPGVLTGSASATP